MSGDDGPTTPVADAETDSLPKRQDSFSDSAAYMIARDALHDDPSPPTPTDVLKRRREAKPRRSILKSTQPAAARFNFRRDILQPINSRLSYIDAQTTSLGADGVAGGGFSWRSALGRWASAAPEASAKSPVSPVVQDQPSREAAQTVTDASPGTSSVLATPALSVAPLKGVRFIMSSLAVVYPINATGSLPPADEAATRQRVEREFRKMMFDRKRVPVLKKGRGALPEGGWTGAELEKLYVECCQSREVHGLPAVRAAFQVCRSVKSQVNTSSIREQENLLTPPRTLNLAHQHLSLDGALALSDLLSIDWGLRKLVLEDAGLDDDSLKPIIHALLISANLPTLSLANNKRIRARGWRFVAVLVSKALRLAFLDLSDNVLDRRTVEWLLQAFLVNQLTRAESPSLTPRRSDDSLRNGWMPTDSAKTSDGVLSEERLEAFLPKAPLLKHGGAHFSGHGMLTSLKLDNCGLRNQALEVLAHGIRTSSIKHISLRRNRISPLGAVALAVMMRDYNVASDGGPLSADATDDIPANSPAFSSSAVDGRNSVTAAHRSDPRLYGTRAKSRQLSTPLNYDAEEDAAFGTERRPILGDQWKPDGARLRLQKEIDLLPRIGNLLTLDVRSNEIKGGVVYIAQVLKRNKTLRVINLSDNKIDPSGLAAIAEALRHNGTLETLDMSKNPCSGSALEGILALRAALAQNNTLLRVFLNNTALGSDGAISLAEFLPDMSGIIHLDITENLDIEIAGVMALSAAVKLNASMRCLDINIPPNDPEFSRLSQDILTSCIRNTEVAQEVASAKGITQTVAAPIHTSTVARTLEESRINGKGRPRSSSTVGMLLSAAQNIHDILFELVCAAEERQREGQHIGSEALLEVTSEAQVYQTQIAEALPAIRRTDRKDRLAVLRDQLSSLAERANQLIGVHQRQYPVQQPLVGLMTSEIVTRSPALDASPSFSITDSDDESDTASDDHVAGQTKPTHITMPPETSSMLKEWSTTDAGPLQSPRSPVEQHSRTLTLEEGEVFRRKAILDRDAQADSSDSDEERKSLDDRDVSGEELRKELLEVDGPVVERPSPRLFTLSPPASPKLVRDSAEFQLDELHD